MAEFADVDQPLDCYQHHGGQYRLGQITKQTGQEERDQSNDDGGQANRRRCLGAGFVINGGLGQTSSHRVTLAELSPAINDPTTAVQALDQIEDLLHRLGRRALDAGCANDNQGQLRLVFPTPTWEDYLTLAFDEIRQYGASSVQVMRRLRSALLGLADSVTETERKEAVQHYLSHLKLVVEHSTLDAEDQVMALQEDRQGLGLSRRRAEP